MNSMSYRAHSTLRNAGLALALLIGSTALAAAAEPAAPPPAADQRGAGPQRFQEHLMARLEGRLAFEKSRLGITDAQMRAWNTYAEAMRKTAHERLAKMAERRGPEGREPGAQGPRRGNAENAKPPTLLERFDARKQALADRTAWLSATEDAAKGLYGTLTDDQKRIADRLLAPGRGLMRMGENGPRHGGMHRRPTYGHFGPEHEGFRRPFWRG